MFPTVEICEIFYKDRENSNQLATEFSVGDFSMRKRKVNDSKRDRKKVRVAMHLKFFIFQFYLGWIHLHTLLYADYCVNSLSNSSLDS